MDKQEQKKGGILNWIERVGNKIPHPFVLFFYLIVLLSLLSLVMNKLGVSVLNPSNNEIVEARNIFFFVCLQWLLMNSMKNFTSFAPLGLVIVMAMAIGLAEEVGLLDTFMRKSIMGVSPRLITFVIAVVGICGNVASNAAIIIIPSIAGMIFHTLGRNPIAGIGLGYAATSAGFSANLIIAGTDGLLTGITNEASKIVGLPEIPVTGNWYFMIASTFLIALVCTVVSEKIIEPRLGKLKNDKKISNVQSNEVTEIQSKGLKKAGIGLIVFLAIIVILAIPQDSILRNPETGSLVNGSVLFSAIIPIMFLLFLAVSVPYGMTVGTIKEVSDIPKYMTKGIKTVDSFIVTAFIMGQFIALFDWSNIGTIIAVSGADLLNKSGFIGIPLIVSFILIMAGINIFILSGSSKWAMVAPVFIPMFGLLNYNPGFVQIMGRLADSATNIISPLNSAIPVLLGYMNEYDEEAGVGTLFSMTIPYAAIILAVWIIFLIIWFKLGLPFGPGVGAYIN